jgi:erythromycin esterase-like protein
MNDPHPPVRLLYGTWAVLIAALLCAPAPRANAGRPPTAPEVSAPGALIPVEPIAAILDAFQTHPIVALGEGPHGNEQGHAFRLALIRDPRFAATVTDIVVEFGSARYQALMDRFVNGADVPDSALKHAWQDTTVTTSVWDRPIYEEFFRVVRTVNAGLPAGRKLRVLLGDAPID